MKFLLVLLAVLPSLSYADLYRGPLSSSMGGTGRAAMNSPEGVFLNPALVPLMKDYEFDAFYRDGLLDPGQHNTTYGIGAADNTADVLFPGSLHYIRMRDTGRASGATDGELFHVALGKNFGNFAVGISGYRLTSKVEHDREYVQWNSSIGFLALISSDMGVGYVLKNLARPGGQVPKGLRENLQQGLGYFASLGEIARVRVDITREETDNIDKKLSYMIGCENLASKFGVFRIGYRRDDQHQQDYLTLGAGLEGPRLKIDYAFEKNLKGTGEALHSVDMRLPF